MGLCIGRVAAPPDAVRGFPGQHGAGGVFLWSAVSTLVLERNVKLLTNPVFVRMAIVLLSSVAAFVVGIVAIRLLRRSLVEDSAIPDGSAGESALPMQAFTVIQQLKHVRPCALHNLNGLALLKLPMPG